MAHDGEKEEKLHRVDQKKGEEKKIETGEGKGGQPAKKAVRGKGNPKHFGRESQARTQFPIAGMQNGQGEGDGDGTDGDQEQQNKSDLLVGFHHPKRSTKSGLGTDQAGKFFSAGLS